MSTWKETKRRRARKAKEAAEAKLRAEAAERHREAMEEARRQQEDARARRLEEMRAARAHMPEVQAAAERAHDRVVAPLSGTQRMRSRFMLSQMLTLALMAGTEPGVTFTYAHIRRSRWLP